jgi:hypothetical protein
MKEFEFFNKHTNTFNQFLNLTMKEGLINSVSYEVFIEKLTTILLKYTSNDYFFIDNKNDEYVYLNLILVGLNKKEKYNLFKEIQSFLNNSGYFISQVVNDNGFKIDMVNLEINNELHIFFNKRFDIPTNTPNILYHTTLKEYYDNKIKNIGLIPKTQKMVSDDLERLYFTDNLNDAEKFIDLKYITLRKKYKNISMFKNIDLKKWTILAIDVKSLGDIKIYKDTKMENSYYTYQTIPPYSIRIEKEIILP